MVLQHDPLKEDVTEPFDKFSDDEYPAVCQDTFDKLNRIMGATNIMALYTIALLSYISFLSSSPVINLPTPSLTSQEDDSDLDDDDDDDDDDDSDDIIPDLVNISSASSKDTLHPSSRAHLHQLQRHDFFITSIKGITPPPAPSCAICGSPVVDSPHRRFFPNSPNNLFTLSDLEHRNPGYMQAHSTIYANDSAWRW
ncbi:hypothetical protein D6C79_08161 [Aureobasidium pullulans]|nr:hypothetical protein D6C79_08161 [Aureobasidium pullulans]